MDEWLAYFLEAADAFADAVAAQTRLWLSEHVMSEGYDEACSRTERARCRFEERLTAYNAYREQHG